MKKSKGTVFLTFLPALIMMAVIFYFSSCPAVESTQTSSRVIDFLIDGWEFISGSQLSPEQTVHLSEALVVPVRKGAHMLEYALLSWCFFLGIYNLVRWYPYIPAFICTFFYAGTDEFHQLYVQGRAGRVTDVLIDSAGALIALTVLHFILRRWKHGGTEHKESGEG